MIKLALSGAAGRMCRTIYKSLIGTNDFVVSFGVDPYPASDLQFPLFQSFQDANLDCDVIIDFSCAKSLDDVLDYAVKNNKRLVLASTGHSAEQLDKINSASTKIAIFKASNMSLGVNLLASLAKDAAKFLGESYDVEIIETHHNKKLDAPSGTALTLANAVAEVRTDLEYKFGRHESATRRDKRELGIHAVRGGTVVGKHDVCFFGLGEVLKLSHEAESKEVFVRGALTASEYLMSKDSGIYDMNTILGDYYAVTNVSSEDGQSLIALPHIDAADFLELLTQIKQNNINLDMISQNSNIDGTQFVSFSLSDNDIEKVKSFIKTDDYIAECGKCKLTSEGAGMEHKSGVALEVLTIFKKIGAKVYSITTSETKITCIIDNEFKADAMDGLRAFYCI